MEPRNCRTLQPADLQAVLAVLRNYDFLVDALDFYAHRKSTTAGANKTKVATASQQRLSERQVEEQLLPTAGSYPERPERDSGSLADHVSLEEDLWVDDILSIMSDYEEDPATTFRA